MRDFDKVQNFLVQKLAYKTDERYKDTDVSKEFVYTYVKIICASYAGLIAGTMDINPLSIRTLFKSAGDPDDIASIVCVWLIESQKKTIANFYYLVSGKLCVHIPLHVMSQQYINKTIVDDLCSDLNFDIFMECVNSKIGITEEEFLDRVILKAWQRGDMFRKKTIKKHKFLRFFNPFTFSILLIVICITVALVLDCMA